jgi:hypothetical protein
MTGRSLDDEEGDGMMQLVDMCDNRRDDSRRFVTFLSTSFFFPARLPGGPDRRLAGQPCMRRGRAG